MSLCILLSLAASSDAQPAIHFDHSTYDFPEIDQEDQVEHVFAFANAGDRELVIEKLDAS